MMHHTDQLQCNYAAVAPIFLFLLAVLCQKCHTKVPNLGGPDTTFLVFVWEQQECKRRTCIIGKMH